jgi:hypothetical protein
MALTCPACNTAGQTEPACARWGCDLSQLHAIVVAAASCLSAARAAFEDRDWSGALARAEQSWRLYHSLGSAHLAFLAAAAGGDSGRALRWHRCALAAAR